MVQKVRKSKIILSENIDLFKSVILDLFIHFLPSSGRDQVKSTHPWDFAQKKGENGHD